MKTLFVPAIAGMLGTLVMSIVLWLPAKLGIARVDVVRALGAYITKSRDNAFTPGIIIHFVFGILFAYGYYWVLHLSHLPLTALWCLFVGVVHGALVMLLVGIAVLEHHPVEHYQEARGPMTGIAQIVGHAFYGLVVGLVFQLSGV